MGAARKRCATQGARVAKVAVDVDGTTAARSAREAIGAGAGAGYTADVSDEHSIARARHDIADD